MTIASGVRWFGERERTTKKYMEKASWERNAKGWFKNRGCTRLNKMERRCLDDSYEKHPAISLMGTKPD